MTRSRSTTLMLGIGVTLVVAMAWLLYYMFGLIRQTNQAIAGFQSTLEFDKQKQDYLISTGRVIQSANSDISRINNSIIPSDGEVSFIEQIEALARSNNLQITIDSLSADSSDALDAAGMGRLTIKIKSSGAYASIHRFLQQIEAMPLKMALDQVNLQTDRSKDKAIAPWNLTMTIYVLKYK